VALFGSLRKTAAFGQKKQLSIQTLTEKYATFNQIGLLGFSRFGHQQPRARRQHQRRRDDRPEDVAAS
jgi:FPC/CPF motif-containing protein YcgG